MTEEEYLSRSCGGVIEFGDVDGNQDGSLSEAEYASISRSHSHDGCDPDPSVGCVIVTAPGSPPIWWWPPSGGGGYDPNPPGCSLDDPDCDDSGGGSSNNQNAQECMDLLREIPAQCEFDPEGPNEYNWNGQGSSLYNARNAFNALPATGWPRSFAPVSIYQSFVREIAITYWGNQSQTAVNQTYWDEIRDYCSTFPLDGGLFYADRSYCYSRAYRTSILFLPTYSDSAFTVSEIQAFGITVQHHSGANPLGNWGATFYSKVSGVKLCKLWHDRKQQLGGCN